MDKQKQLCILIIKALYGIGEGFDKYWDSMSDLDHDEILETLTDVVYDWLAENANTGI